MTPEDQPAESGNSGQLRRPPRPRGRRPAQRSRGAGIELPCQRHGRAGPDMRGRAPHRQIIAIRPDLGGSDPGGSDPGVRVSLLGSRSVTGGFVLFAGCLAGRGGHQPGKMFPDW